MPAYESLPLSTSQPPVHHHLIHIKHADDGCYLGAPLLRDYKAATGGVDEGVRNEGTSFLRTCINGLNALAGVGILSIPYALSEGGWLSLIFLLIVALTCCYTGILLQRCMMADPYIKTYPDIGQLAFGSKGRIIVSFFMYLEVYLVAIEFLILEGDNLEKLFPGGSFVFGFISMERKTFFTVLATLVILPTTWLRNLNVFAYVSAGGVLASILVLLSVVSVGVFDDVGFHQHGRLFSLSGLPTALGLYSFCYCGHAVFPTIYTSMKKKSQFSKVLYICFILCTLNYGSMAIIGYLMYGQSVTSQITLNLPKGSIRSYIAIFTTLVNPFTKYALMVSPVASAIEERFMFSNKNSYVILTRTLLVASNLLIALVVPFFGYVMALIGSFLSVVVSMLLPCLCYLKIFGVSRRSKFELATMAIISLMGTSVAVFGTYTSLKQIASNM